MELRQVALVAENLDQARQDIFALLGIRADFDDEGVAAFGLRNSVMAIGDTFLEVVSPKQPDTTAGRLLQRRGGDGGYMVIAQVSQIADASDRIDALGMRKVWQVDRPEVTAFHIHPKDIGAAIVSFDEMRPATEWLWGGPDWREQRAVNVSAITGVEVQGVDPEALAANWGRAFDVTPVLAGDALRLQLDQGFIDIIEAKDGRGDGVSGVSFSVTDADAIRQAAEQLSLSWQQGEIEVCGTRFRFEGT